MFAFKSVSSSISQTTEVLSISVWPWAEAWWQEKKQAALFNIYCGNLFINPSDSSWINNKGNKNDIKNVKNSPSSMLALKRTKKVLSLWKHVFSRWKDQMWWEHRIFFGGEDSPVVCWCSANKLDVFIVADQLLLHMNTSTWMSCIPHCYREEFGSLHVFLLHLFCIFTQSVLQSFTSKVAHRPAWISKRRTDRFLFVGGWTNSD